jgi:hypothetical protein
MRRVLWVRMALVLAAWGPNKGGRSSRPREARRAPLVSKECIFALPRFRETLDALNQVGRALRKMGHRPGRVFIRRGSAVRQADPGATWAVCPAVERVLQRFIDTVRPLMGESQ